MVENYASNRTTCTFFVNQWRGVTLSLTQNVLSIRVLQMFWELQWVQLYCTCHARQEDFWTSGSSVHDSVCSDYVPVYSIAATDSLWLLIAITCGRRIALFYDSASIQPVCLTWKADCASNWVYRVFIFFHLFRAKHTLQLENVGFFECPMQWKDKF